VRYEKVNDDFHTDTLERSDEFMCNIRIYLDTRLQVTLDLNFWLESDCIESDF